MDVVANIKALRIEKGITQEVLADALKVDTAVVSNIEKGKRDLRVKELELIASCLNVDILYLFTYPKKFIDQDSIDALKDDKVSITFEVSRSKRDYLLHLVMDEPNKK